MKRRVTTLIIILLLLQTPSSFFQAAFGAHQTTTTTTPIKHVIIIMMENHSFDNIFGLYPTMNKTTNALLQSIQAPDDLLNVSRNIIQNLEQVPNGTFWTADPDESVYYNDWDGGKMDGFASSGGQSMTFFSSSQLAIEWDWAEEYAIGDMYFSSCLCETNPNRLFSLAGYGAGLTGDSGPPPYVPVNESIFGELSSNGVSWGYYIENPSSDNFPLDYFSGINEYFSKIQSWSNFDSSLQQDSLPSVSWVMPVGGGAYGVDQHHAYNMTGGQDWLLGVVDKVMVSPYWNSTAILITYDEGGGYYDHIPPPVIGGLPLGFRVPLFVISPYAKENYVSHTVMNHASLLAFIDYNWHLPALNTFVADSGLPLDMFNFQNSSNVLAPIVLTDNSKFPVSPQIPFSELSYERQGSTNEKLATSSGGEGTLFVENNSTTIPFYQSLPFVAAVSLILLGFVVVLIRRQANRFQTKSSPGGARG
jgi:phospholipase C